MTPFAICATYEREGEREREYIYVLFSVGFIHSNGGFIVSRLRGIAGLVIDPFEVHALIQPRICFQVSLPSIITSFHSLLIHVQ
jgi:hypothetical protein